MNRPDFHPSRPTSGFDANALTRALRIAGAVLVVASASTFMLQGWQGGNDLIRYAMLVGQSLLLTAAAYFVGLTVREGRSARTFLALVLATIPVTFAVLGGLVYSQFHLEPLRTLPSYASWVAPSPSTALLAVAATLVVMIPLAIVAFIALARKQWKALTLSFLAGNVLMLIPARTPSLIIVEVGALLLGLTALELSRFSRELATLEGGLARVALFLPPLIMLGRVIHLYRPTAAFYGGSLLIGAAALWLAIPTNRQSRLRDAGACLCAALGTAGWIACFSELWPYVRSSASVLVLGLPCALIAFASALRASGAKPLLSAIGLVFLLTTAAIGAVTGMDTLSPLLGIAIGIGVAVWGAAQSSTLRTIAGSAVAMVGLGVQLWTAVQANDLLRWVSLTVAGVLLIVGAAFVERHRLQLARHFAAEGDASG
jgi:hypothetical protein